VLLIIIILLLLFGGGGAIWLFQVGSDAPLDCERLTEVPGICIAVA
jgi:hypothetical protein